MREHELKTWPEFFAALRDGSKTFEIRKDDRGFAVGDTLVLKEWDPSKYVGTLSRSGGYTGEELVFEVSYKFAGGRMGIPEGVCILGLRALASTNTEGADNE